MNGQENADAPVLAKSMCKLATCMAQLCQTYAWALHRASGTSKSPIATQHRPSQRVNPPHATAAQADVLLEG
jgi:hypothetical protein